MRKPQRTDGSAWQASLGLWCVALAALTALAINSLVWAQREPARARITIDARKVSRPDQLFVVRRVYGVYVRGQQEWALFTATSPISH